MPRSVQNLFAKVDRLDVDVILLAVLEPWSGSHLVLSRAHPLGLEGALVGLECDVVGAVAVKDVEVVVV